MTPPPRLFARPLLGDVLRAFGLAIPVGGVLSSPFWLPTPIHRWVFPLLMGLALWFVAFLTVRMVRQGNAYERQVAARRPPHVP